MKKYKIWLITHATHIQWIHSKFTVEADKIEIKDSGQTVFYLKNEIVMISPKEALIETLE